MEGREDREPADQEEGDAGEVGAAEFGGRMKADVDDVEARDDPYDSGDDEQVLATHGEDRSAFATRAVQHLEDEGEGRDEAGGEDRHPGVGQADPRYAEEHPDEVRDEPEEPDEPREGVELGETALILAGEDDARPRRVDRHEDEGDPAGRRVEAGAGTVIGGGDSSHDRGADRVEGEARPEESEVASGEDSGALFAEDSDRVEEEGCGDGGDGRPQHGGHGVFLQMVRSMRGIIRSDERCRVRAPGGRRGCRGLPCREARR